ncbi:MAG TPA: site-specific integrase [Herpetosiphonaceae bacterium]|nr:site-specific integrase [Herpetosiphonaceae bacterium]
MAGRSTVDTLAQVLAQFETIGMPARNLATRTRREYARDLRDVLSYLEQGGSTRLDEVRPRDLEGYLAELDRRGLQGSTRNRKVHTLKTFFKWLMGQEIVMSNPAAQLVAPRAIKKEPRYLSEGRARWSLRHQVQVAYDRAFN